MEKRIIISVLAFYFMLNLQGSAQSEATNPYMIPTKTPNSILFGTDVVIDDQPGQNQQAVCLSVAFNGWLYAGYTVEEGSSHKWMIMRSTDNGETWSVLREQPLAPDWYNPDFDMVVC
ncbi:MAG: exo-alpha-sialidase, partial [Bacteroidales bacterium]|nr:exo-alpha-sialidase [Bacteroidales bacterium]